MSSDRSLKGPNWRFISILDKQVSSTVETQDNFDFSCLGESRYLKSSVTSWEEDLVVKSLQSYVVSGDLPNNFVSKDPG